MNNPVEIASELRERLAPLAFSSPVTHVYNPLNYGWKAHVEYLERFTMGPKEILFLGMNPGPFGMAQTAVPFGDPAIVRDVLGLSETVGQPETPHPKRPILGPDSTRKEVSGQRVWSWVQNDWGGVEVFTKRAVITNYCPLCFMEESGRNRTPDKLKKHERDRLTAACDAALKSRFAYHQPSWVIGFGAYAERCAQRVLGDTGVQIGRILHPSPASPAANRGWAPQANAQLHALGIDVG